MCRSGISASISGVKGQIERAAPEASGYHKDSQDSHAIVLPLFPVPFLLQPAVPEVYHQVILSLLFPSLVIFKPNTGDFSETF